MKINTSLHTQVLSEKAGKQIINIDRINILDLDQQEIIQLFKAEGLLLFRGFETNVEIFTKFSNIFSTNFMDYTGGVFNRKIINNDPTVLTVNDFQTEIKLHGEMYYQQNIPLMLWFFCAHPALQDGETIVCDGQLFYNEMSNSLKNLFSKKKLKYNGHLNQDEWKKRYKTDDLSVIKQICESNKINIQVNENESIDLHYTCPAIHLSKYGNHPVFINSLLPTKSLYPKAVCFDDDSEITDDIISELSEIAAKTTVDIRWQKGDILMVDNTRIMHGRRAFADDQRDIYLRLCSPSF
ncbi:MAG: TauD/TfdA family dioxygenase [Phormidium sp.]